MRVLHVVKGLGPGGAERLLVSLAAATPQIETHVAYLLPWKDHLVTDARAAGAVTHLISGRRGLTDPRWLRALRRLIRSLGPDLVHVHSPAVAVGVRLVVRSIPHRPALVSTEHNLWPSFGLPTRLCNALTSPLDDLRLAVSEEVRSSMWRPWRGKVDVLIHGVPVQALAGRRGERDAARHELGVGPDEVLVVTIANFREKKDYPTLLDAAARAIRDEPRLRFVAVGQGPLEQELRSLHAHHRLGDRFRFTGYHPDPARVLAAADVFALSSRHEGLPIALLEAISLGLPVVATTVGGIPAVVRDGVEGVLLEPGDAGALARELTRLARSSEIRHTMGRRAAERAPDYDIASAAANLLTRYERFVRPG